MDTSKAGTGESATSANGSVSTETSAAAVLAVRAPPGDVASAALAPAALAAAMTCSLVEPPS